MKTGIFSGSFNPIHIGHLALANYLCEFAGLDEVWFVVSPLNPLKDEADFLAADVRQLFFIQIANHASMQNVFARRRRIQTADDIHQRGFP